MIAAASHRVLFVSHTNEWIGPNISLLELVTRLPDELSPLVVVPGTGRFTEALEEHGIPVRSIRRLDKFGIPALVRTIRLNEISLVYGNSSSGASKNALIAAKVCHVPFVYHLREMAGFNKRRGARLFNWADAAIAVSRATADSYRGVMRRPPSVIYNGVSLERFDLDRAACREQVAAEFGIPKTAPLVIHAGNVYPRKGQRLAIEVARELQRNVPGSCLLLAGRLDRDAEYVESMRTSISEAGLENQVFLTGLRTDIERLMAASDAFLHTATEDPHPRTVIEAMATGLPVVALAVGGVMETVVDGETGYLVSPPGDAVSLATYLQRLVEKPELRQIMGTMGRNRTRDLFSAECTARKVASVILDLVGSE